MNHQFEEYRVREVNYEVNPMALAVILSAWLWLSIEMVVRMVI